MKCIPLIGLLMAALVASLPVAAAHELNIIRFSGHDRVNGYGRTDDTLTVTVQARVDGQSEIRNDELFLTSEDFRVPFESCTRTDPDSNFFNCTYSEDYTDAIGTESYAIELKNHDGAVVKTADQDFTIDLLKPEIAEYTVEPESTSEGRFTAHVVAEDYGSQSGLLEHCSGVKSITLSVNGQPVATAPGDKEACRIEKFLDFTRSAEGRVQLCASAIDYLGQASDPVCHAIAVDRSAPAISNLDLRGKPGDFRLTFLRTGQDMLADVSVVITDDSGVRPDSVSASFSALSPSTGERPVDDVAGDTYVWHNVPIENPADCRVTVTATDLLGNTATQELTCSIGVDDDAPVATDIKATGEYPGGVPVFGTGGYLKALFTEDGIGMATANAKMDLHTLGLGIRTASRCVREGNSWACYWDDLKPLVPAGSYTVTVTSAADDLGNPMAAQESAEVLYDNVAPVILGFNNVRIFHNTAEFGNFTVKGDGIEVSIRVAGADSGIADFTEMGGAAETPGTCIATGANESLKNCTFAGIIDVSGPAPVTTTYTLSDIAGNKVQTTFQFFVYEVLDEPEPDYWRSSVDCTPALIDRSVTSLLEHKVYCKVHLTKKTPTANISVANAVAGELTECTGSVSGNLVDVRALNTRAGTTDPFLVLTLAASDFTMNELPLSCPLKIYSRVGSRLARNPETEQANVTLKFYNSPLGELNNNIDKDIERDKRKAEKTLKWVGTLQKYMSYAEKVCQIKGVLTSVLTLLNVVQVGIGAITAALDAGTVTTSEATQAAQLRSALCNGPNQAVEQLLGSGAGSIFKLLDQFCGIINCAASSDNHDIISLDTLGGGAPWCKYIKQAVSGELFLGSYDAQVVNASTGYSLSASVNVKESLILSAACLCIPGIIYNLNKYREIVCQGALCKVQLKNTGVPLSYCNDIESYMTCTFVVGEIFNLIPFAGIYNQIVNILKDIWSNPIAAVALVAGLLCKNYCSAEVDRYNGAYALCAIPKVLAKVGDAVGSIKSIKRQGYWQTGDTFCEQLEDAD